MVLISVLFSRVPITIFSVLCGEFVSSGMRKIKTCIDICGASKTACSQAYSDFSNVKDQKINMSYVMQCFFFHLKSISHQYDINPL